MNKLPVIPQPRGAFVKKIVFREQKVSNKGKGIFAREGVSNCTLCLQQR